MDNKEIENELYGFDFELFRIDYTDGEKLETSIKSSESIEEMFDRALMLSTKALNQLRKRHPSPKTRVESISTEYGYEIYLNADKVHEFYIRELKKEAVS